MTPRIEPAANVLGLEAGRVEVVPYTPRWIDEFARESQTLLGMLGSSILMVHHVGSTAVPGLCAKPVLDVLVSVPDLERSRTLVPSLEAYGYQFRPGEEIPDRHYFRRLQGTAQTHHLSLAEPGSQFHRRTVAFRDALRANPETARAYCELKRSLAERFPFDRGRYIEGKSEFVAGVLAASATEGFRDGGH